MIVIPMLHLALFRAVLCYATFGTTLTVFSYCTGKSVVAESATIGRCLLGWRTHKCLAEQELMQRIRLSISSKLRYS